MLAYNISNQGKFSIFLNGKSYMVDSNHVNYEKILEALKASDEVAIETLVNVEKTISEFSNDHLKIENGNVTFKGQLVVNELTQTIVKFMKDGLPFKPLIRFFENLMNNPSYRAVQELYLFLQKGNLPITEDGCFLAFKNVRSNYKDIYSGNFDNSVGKVLEMPRNFVDDNRDNTCSNGFHFCSIEYLPSFTDSNGGKTMVLKINPADVVSIPSDYNNTKGRCCKYEVVDEYKENWRERRDNGFDDIVFTEKYSNCDDYEEDDYEEDDYKEDDCDEYVYSDDDEDDSLNECENNCHSHQVNYHNQRDSKGRFTKKN